MPRQGLLAFAVVLGAGVALLIVLSLVGDRSQAFTLGVRADAAVVKLRPDSEVCQRPIEVLDSFERMRVQLGTYRRPGSPYSVEVRPDGGGAALATASVPGDYADNEVQSVRLSREIPDGREVAVCIRNTARQPVAVYGGSDASNSHSTSYLNGRPTDADIMLVFEYSDARSTLDLLPAIVRRAALFHGEWASTAAYWALLAVLVGTLATLPALALRSALRQTPERD
jgi:hypothetical protein